MRLPISLFPLGFFPNIFFFFFPASQFSLQIATKLPCPTNLFGGLSYCTPATTPTPTTTTASATTTTSSAPPTQPPVAALDESELIDIILGCVFFALVTGLLVFGIAFYRYGLKKPENFIQVDFEQEELAL